MTALEIVLLICGVICVVLSFVLSSKEDGKTVTPEVINTDLTSKQKDEIKQQINEIVKEELEDINERTEASLDKISNTKILEMNEYAETVMGEINRNHNETVFLYDMLNEKAKEIKTTVKDVNIAKRQVEKIQSEVTLTSESDASPAHETAAALEEVPKANTVRDDAKERLSELVRKSNEKARKQGESGNAGHQAVKLDDMVSHMKADKEEDANEHSGKKDSDKKESVVAGKEITSELDSVKTSTDHNDETIKADAKIDNEIVDALVETDETQETVKNESDKTVTKSAKSEKAEHHAKSVKKSKAKHNTKQTADAEFAKNIDLSPITEQEKQSAASKVTKMNIQFDKGANNNDKILKLFSMGMSNKEIAKELNLGVGEVKLVIDLYNSGNK